MQGKENDMEWLICPLIYLLGLAMGYKWGKGE